MTRTTDPDPQPFQPLGEKVAPKKPADPEWVPVPDSPNVERNVVTGRVRTAIPLPKGHP